jgi:hypothetical protein
MLFHRLPAVAFAEVLVLTPQAFGCAGARGDTYDWRTSRRSKRTALRPQHDCGGSSHTALLIASFWWEIQVVMVGAHWPSDLIAGAGVGWMVVALAQEWESRQAWQPRLQTRWAQIALLLAEIALVTYLFLASTHTPAERLAFDLIATVGIAGALSRFTKLRQQSAS